MKAYPESETYDSASVVPIHTRSELFSDSDSASVASVNQPLMTGLKDNSEIRGKQNSLFPKDQSLSDLLQSITK